MKKRNKLSLLGLIIILVLGPLAYFRFIKPKLTKAAWFDDKFYYRKAVNITNSSGSALTDFQVSINIGTSALIAAGKMQSGCNDVRITDVNGKLLPHWVETAVNTCNNSSNSTYIWTKVPSIPTAGATIYFYYGNSSATNSENGSQVFYFFDGFDGTSLDSKWTTITNDSISVSGSYLEIDRTSSSTSVAASYTPLAESVIEFRGIQIMEATSFRNRLYFGTLSGTTFTASQPASVDYGLFYDAINAPCEVYHNGWQNVMLDTTSLFSIKHILHGSVVDSYYRNQSTAAAIYSVTDLTPSIANSSVNGVEFAVTEQNTSHFKIDTVFVRKYASSDPTTSLASEEVGTGPIAYWKFDEGYGTTTSDSSSSRNNGTITGAVWKSEDLCVSGKCLYFDGSADNVSISSSIVLAPNPGFTFSHWLRTASTGGQVYTLGNTGGGSGYRFGIDSGVVAFLIGSVSGGYSEKTCGTTTVNDNKWHLITGVFGSTSLTCYIDGRLEATVAYDLGEDYTGMSTSAPGIGAPPCCTDFQGFLDDVKIYPYQRTAAQVKSDYNAGKRGMGTNKGSSVNLGGNAQQSEAFSEGLVGYWKMEENTGTTTADASGNGNTGTLGTGNSAPGWSPGMYGVGLSFDGSNDYVSITGFGNLAPIDDITISLWIKTSTKQQSAFMFNPDSGSNRINFHPCYINGITYWDFGDIATGGRLSYSNPSHCSSPSWQYYTLVSSHTDNYMAIYRNGIREAYGNSHSHFSRTNTDLWIGGIKDYSLNGFIDEVRIYNRALSPVEVQQLYNWAPGPVGYWKMEEGSGASANDSSTNGNTGTLGTGNSAPTWTTGKYGKGLSFDGGNDVVSVADATAIEPTSGITAEAWVKFNGWYAGACLGNALFSKGHDGLNGHYQILIADTGGCGAATGNKYAGFSIRFSDGTGEGVGSTASSNFLSTGVWYHFSGTYDGITMKLYKNGVLIDSKNVSKTMTTNNDLLYFGKMNNSGYPYSLNGTIDEVKIYNYARSVKQIIEDMNAGHPAPGSPVGSQVGYWKFDEGYGTTAYDSSPQKNNGIFSAAPPVWSNNGMFGIGLSFDGSSNMSISAGTAPSLNSTGDVTLSVWIYPTSVGGGSPRTFLWKGKWNVSGGWYLEIGSGTGKVTLTTNDGTLHNLVADEVIPSNQWTYVAAVHSGTTWNMFINGRKQSSSITASITDHSANNFCIGSYECSASRFSGLIDEVKYYNSALTDEEIKVDYNHGSAIVLGSTSVNTGNTASINAESQAYCVPGDTAVCSPPVAEWKMEEGSGTSANDSSTYGNTGTLGAGNSAPTWTTGKYGKGLSFDGSRSFININSSSSLNPGNDITLSTWVYWNGGTGDRNIVTKENAYEFRVNGGYINYAINPWAWRGGTDAPISPNKWQYVVITNDSDGLQKIYIDGVEKHSESSGGAITSNSDVVTIGARNAGAGSFFGGLIDEVKIYNYARTPAQIAWDYNRGGPAGHWKFNECQGTTVNDSSGNNNTGTITIGIGASGSQNTAGTCNSGVGSSAAWGNGSLGKFNSSLNLDGTDDYVTLSNNSPLDVLGSAANPVTVSAWVKPNNSSGYVTFFTKGRYLALYNGTTPVAFLYDPSELYPPAANPNYWFWGSASATIGSWNNIVFTFDGTVVSWYVNGKLNTSASLPGIQVGWSGTAYLGKTYTGDPAEYTNGQIDEVQVYNYALTATQVKILYNEGGAVRFGPITGTP